MGREYIEELGHLPATVEWARNLNLKKQTERISKLSNREMVVIASGGSFCVAQLIAQLHTAATGRMATAMTPLEFLTSGDGLDDIAVFFVSASGANQDILNAWKAAIDREIRDIVILCGSPKSSLAEKAAEAAIPVSVTFDLPAGRDGFLATNSLVAFWCLALKLYGQEIPQVDFGKVSSLARQWLPRRSLIVLYSGWLKPVALDVESRFSEAALGSVSLADYRNFAHGRHYWLARNAATTSVLALVSPDVNDLASATLEQFPRDVAVTRWDLPEGSPQSALIALLASIELAGIVARDLGFDAGRPGVPAFGENIYNLRTKPVIRSAFIEREEAAIARKSRAGGIRSSTESTNLEEALKAFENRLGSVDVHGIVLDYDGTVVATERRFEDIEPAMSRALNGLLEDGIELAIATGRGKSCHPHLRRAIREDFWPRVTIGYYNGGTQRLLSDSVDGLGDPPYLPLLQQAHDALKQCWHLKNAEFELRDCQLSVKRPGFREHGLWLAVGEVLDRLQISGLKVRHSSHSVDILPATVSKSKVVHDLAKRQACHEASILKFGDRGAWPGNDSELLAMSSGLSVDDVSADPLTCWNLLPRGVRGHHGTLWYLERIRNKKISL